MNTLLDTNPISNQFEIAAMNIEYDFGLQAEDVAVIRDIVISETGMTAGQIKIVEAS